MKSAYSGRGPTVWTQQALPGLGEDKPESISGASELPSKVLSQMQFHFRPAYYNRMTPPAPKSVQQIAGQGFSSRNEVFAMHRPSGQEAGYLGWSGLPHMNLDEGRWGEYSKGGEIKMVQTEQPFQHQGVASHMWNFAHEQVNKLNPQPVLQPKLFRLPRRKFTGNTAWRKDAPIYPPEHSANRTAAGEGWSKAVGGDRPPRSDWRD